MTEAEKSGIEAERVAQISCAQCQKILDVSHLPSFSEIKCPACGMPQVVPARFGGFFLIGRLGSGGMGMVYHAMDKDLGRHVALKVMKRELGANYEFVQSLKHEAQAAAALNHPNVVQIYSFGQVLDQPYIAMELVSGGRLDERVADGVALEETPALEIHLQVVAGLRAASEIGMVHGDIKPANILFGKNGEAKILDFGLASYIGQQQTGTVMGTPYYIAPEKARGKSVDFRSDIYSLGATLFHVLTGQPPFDGPTPTDVVMARLKQPAPNLLDINPDLHPKTAALVARMLEADPTMRHPSYPALQIDMEAALEDSRQPLKKSTPSGTVLSSFDNLRRTACNRKLLLRTGIGLATVAAIAAITFGAHALHQHQLKTRAVAQQRQQMSKLLQQGNDTFGRIQALANIIIQQGAAVQPLAAQINKITATDSNLNVLAARAALEIDKVDTILNDTADTLAMAHGAHQQLQAATDYTAIQEPARQLETCFSATIEQHNLIQEGKAAAEQATAEANAVRAKADKAAQKARIDAEQKAALAKELKAAKAREQAQAAEIARRRIKLIQTELDMIDKARGANGPLITQRDFEDAAKRIGQIKGNLTQPEAQDYLKNVQDAYMAMAALKIFIIGAINAAPYPNGWATSGTPRDIVRADANKGLTVALGTVGSINVPWDQVTPFQWAKITNYYLEKGIISDAMRADRVLALALFCYESGSFKLAETYAASAGKINPALKTDIQRLMPGFAVE